MKLQLTDINVSNVFVHQLELSAFWNLIYVDPYLEYFLSHVGTNFEIALFISSLMAERLSWHIHE